MVDHTYRQFDTDLQALRNAMTAMADLVERQFLRAVDAVRLKDLNLAAQVLAEESEVNRMHVQTDLRCNTMIAKRQPIAVDLREIIAVLHMNNDLERIGDEAKKIAFKARDLHDRALPIGLERVQSMAIQVCDMLRDSMNSFARLDTHAAQRVLASDVEIDRLRDMLTSELVDFMRQNPQSASTALALVFVVQSIERVGDHAKNVAEFVVNIVEGIDARHRRDPA